jgi:KipI family sensor histidine kinase inhibitor
MKSKRSPQQSVGNASPRFLDAGESALVVEFGDTIDPLISGRVLALDASLRQDPYPGIRELVPTYRSLMVHYDPLLIEREALVSIVSAKLLVHGKHVAREGQWVIPCCYGAEFGEDIDQVSLAARLPADKVVASHADAIYRVYMYGFAPGFSYLGGLPDEIAISRRSTPRPPHAAGAVLVGGGQCAISTFAMPTGWYVVGRTPERLYAPERDNPFLLEPGESVRFEPVDEATYHALERRAATGEIVARRGLQ